MKSPWYLLSTCVLVSGSVSGYQAYPQQAGDLVFRDSKGQIYGRDGTGLAMATDHPGHVGVSIGNGQVVEALGYGQWLIPNVAGEVMVTPLAASPGVHSFYEEWSDSGAYDGIEDHGHMGAKTHGNLLTNPYAATLRSNIVLLAMAQVGQGYDNGFGQQKGPGNDEWTCCGLAEKVYESCAGQTPKYGTAYGDASQYAGGLNITPDGYVWHSDPFSFFYENSVEFSQIPSNLLLGRIFGDFPFIGYFIFFPYSQFQQATLMDSFTERPAPPVISSVLFTNGLFHFTLTSRPGWNYVVEASTNLMNWVMVYSNTATGTAIEFTDTNAANFRERFYRSLVQ